jgi:hypothetical protein
LQWTGYRPPLNSLLGALIQAFCGVLNWNSAKTACPDLGGHLATITSQAENDWVYGNVLSVRITQQQVYASKRTQPNNTFQRSAEDSLC